MIVDKLWIKIGKPLLSHIRRGPASGIVLSPPMWIESVDERVERPSREPDGPSAH
jgi:hypothetical protein